jgi:hypothetical protein
MVNGRKCGLKARAAGLLSRENAGMNAGADGARLTYSYRPSVLGAPMELTLERDALVWGAGAKSGRMKLADVRAVNMSYKPASMQPYRFVTQVWGQGSPSIVIVSTSWRSMVEQERLDKAYVAFVGELHRRIVEAGAPVRFFKGKSAWIYWPGLALFGFVGLLLAAMVPRAWQDHSLAGAAFIAAFLALFLWQGAAFFRRNKPGEYRADEPPPELLPRGGGRA